MEEEGEWEPLQITSQFHVQTLRLKLAKILFCTIRHEDNGQRGKEICMYHGIGSKIDVGRFCSVPCVSIIAMSVKGIR